MVQIEFLGRAEKDLAAIPKKWQQRIAKAIEELGKNPYRGKKLKGEFSGSYSERVWPYRIIYSINTKAKTVVIIKISHRQSVYG